MRVHTCLKSILTDAIDQGATAAELLPNSLANKATRKFPPTLLTGVYGTMRGLQEQIFGPILPIMTYQNIDRILDYINNQDRPLALYLFSDDKALQTKVINKTRSGCMGQYHGTEGFHGHQLTTTHFQAILLPHTHSFIFPLR